VDLAKGFEARNKEKLSAEEIDQFMQNCVNLALQTAPNLITARLLQVELEARKTKYFPSFKNLESLVTQLFADGYLELPELMYSEQPKIVGLDSTYTPFAQENIREGTPTGKGTVLTLSNGRYDEFKNAKRIKTIGSVRFNTEKNKIVGFGENKRQVEVVSRFLSVDPIAKQYPELTPYQFASNSPIAGIDLDGLEHYWTVDKLYLGHVNNANSIENKAVYVVKRADADKVQLEVDKMHNLAQKAEDISLSIRHKLPLNNDQLLDRANWIVAEGNSFYPQPYAESMQKLADKLGGEDKLYKIGMQDNTGKLDKDKYLSGELHNKTGASFYETRNSNDKRSDEHWAALEAVVGSLLKQEFPADNWRGGAGKGEMQGEGGGRTHRFLIYGKKYTGVTPTIDEKYKKPPSVNYKRWYGKTQPTTQPEQGIKKVNELNIHISDENKTIKPKQK
jgi:hypothetical protein